ncbi:MAG TPA: AAA family ATPase [Treponema sp.]|nr:AAA family ATPase [Treponema sp.]
MRRHGPLFIQDNINETRLRTRSRSDRVLDSYLELYIRRLLPEHRFTSTFLALVYSALDENRMRAIAEKLYHFLAPKQLVSAEVLESAERYGCGLEIDDDPEEIINAMLYVSEAKGLQGEAIEILEGLSNFVREPMERVEKMESFSSLVNAYGLDSDELHLILFLFLVSINEKLLSLVSEWKTSEMLRGMSICTGVAQGRLRALISSNSKLRTYNLVEITPHQRFILELNDEVVEYLAASEMGSLYERFLRPAGSGAYPLDSFPVRRDQQELCRTLLSGSRPVQILLYGREGTGKTEFARALGAATGKKVYSFIRSEDSRRDNLTRLSLTLGALSSTDTIVIIDEAESILDGGKLWFGDFMMGNKDQKARINILLDQVRCPVIWIVNSIAGIQSSTLRRFTFSVEFRALKPQILAERVWTALETLPLSEDVKQRAAELASQRELTGAAIANLRAALEELAGHQLDEDRLIKYVDTLFSANSELVGGKQRVRERTGTTYNVDVLNLSQPPERILHAVAHHIATAQAGSNVSGRQVGGLRILFYGMPGTGKTELARHVAERVGCKLDIRRASDILSPYVGEAEKNIAAMFNEAEDSGDILLIDEADAFLYDRSRAHRSWEITQVDEFLTRMEEFRGVLICTTNLLGSLDRAVIRRFQLKVEFQPLHRSGTEELLRTYFPDLNFSAALLDSLAAKGPYVPGDFAVVHSMIAAMPDADITPDFIVQTLIEESRHRKPAGTSIGFTA